MNSIKSKNINNWILAILTALGAYGGFPEAPEWWKKFTKYQIVQFIVLWMLVYQGGGNQEIIWSLLIALIVYVLMNTDKIIAYLKDFLTKNSIARMFDQSKAGKRYKK